MNDTIELLARAVFAGAFLAFLHARARLFLLYFQQEEYDDARFARWLLAQKAFDRRFSLVLAVAGTVAFLAPGLIAHLFLGLAAVAAILLLRMDEAFLAQAKKPLVMTKRAARILWLALGLGAALLLGALVLFARPAGLLASALVLAQGAPALLIAANRLLSPFEKRVQKAFLAEAREKLQKLQPTTVAITGSYGKTSTKLILAHILSTVRPTLATPGSVNTLMGISRIVREQLTPDHRIFIAEMGAYGEGSIAALCDLAPPSLSLVTAVGMAHYERFRTVDAVFRAKMEIAEAARRKGGKTIVNVDQVPEELLRAELARAGAGNFVLVGRKGGAFPLATTIEEAESRPVGLFVALGHEGARHELLVSLHGLHQAANVALAFTAARALGVPPEAIKASLRSVPQIKHRLEVVAARGAPTIIDDGYNSNPDGFRSALDLLDLLGRREEGGRRILITPGMVELGARHDEAHREVGAYAAGRADIVLALGPERLGGFLEGLRSGAQAPEIVPLASQAEAEDWLKRSGRTGDVILFENSLPDLYERPLRL
ncbi:MAG: UDP-N-acetylmuramoyl-tripeptide--D-alanyl-D-alanine ligase [Alphaproteobacteria bacterium]|nr:UDP-N-acetylmuramoyl-tripeptide--D-alanyl-D-alanine ligase [Alphaproteobacteria bacterium]